MTLIWPLWFVGFWLGVTYVWLSLAVAMAERRFETFEYWLCRVLPAMFALLCVVAFYAAWRRRKPKDWHQWLDEQGLHGFHVWAVAAIGGLIAFCIGFFLAVMVNLEVLDLLDSAG